jgi:hypothetical protein
MTDTWHGTTNGYTYHRCRCALCTKAAVDYNAAWRKRVRSESLPPWAQHGQVNTYKNYGCRCELCRVAWSAYLKQRRAAGVR